MLYDRINNTYYIDIEDALLLFGKSVYNQMKESGDLVSASIKEIREKKTKTPKKKIKNRKIICVETGCVYESATQAAKVLGFNQSNISNCCLGKLKHYKGYHWQFV